MVCGSALQMMCAPDGASVCHQQQTHKNAPSHTVSLLQGSECRPNHPVVFHSSNMHQHTLQWRSAAICQGGVPAAPGWLRDTSASHPLPRTPLTDCALCSAMQFACTTAALGVIAAELLLRDPHSSTASSDAQTSRRSSSKAEASTLAGEEQALAQILSNPLFRPAVAGAAFAVVLSVLLPPEELPVLSSLCLVAYAGLAVTKVRFPSGAPASS